MQCLLFGGQLTLVVVAVLGLLSEVKGHSFGAPEDACKSMVPDHGSKPQKGDSPYVMEFSQKTYSPGDVINVSLKGKKGESLRGFLVQARKEGRKPATVGKLEGDKTETLTECDDDMASLTHTNNNDKTLIEFLWTAPDSDEGDIKFTYTVVQTRDVYWTKLTADKLTYKPAENGDRGKGKGKGNDDDTTTTMSSTTSTSTTTSAQTTTSTAASESTETSTSNNNDVTSAGNGGDNIENEIDYYDYYDDSDEDDDTGNDDDNKEKGGKGGRDGKPGDNGDDKNGSTSSLHVNLHSVLQLITLFPGIKLLILNICL